MQKRRSHLAAANCINTGHYAEALNALNSVPAGKRNARWYYLSALAQAGLHNNAQAMEYARQAVSMEPGNMQYQQLLSQLQGGGSWYGQRGTTYGRQTYGQPNLCCTFLALQMCCSCCSGRRDYGMHHAEYQPDGGYGGYAPVYTG